MVCSEGRWRAACDLETQGVPIVPPRSQPVGPEPWRGLSVPTAINQRDSKRGGDAGIVKTRSGSLPGQSGYARAGRRLETTSAATNSWIVPEILPPDSISSSPYVI